MSSDSSPTARTFGLSRDREASALQQRSAIVEGALLVAVLLSATAVLAASAWNMRELIVAPAAPSAPSDASEAAAQAPSAQRAVAATSEASTEPSVAAQDETSLRRVRPLDRRAWKEGDFYAEFRADEHLAERALALLDGDGPRCEKMALLRALYDAGDPSAAACFAHAFATQPDVSDERGESVPRAAIHWLATRAPREAAARAILANAWTRDPPPADDLRTACALACVQSAPENELDALAARVAHERDESLAAQLRTALAARRSLTCDRELGEP